jgi:hypothetical protein
MIDYTIVTSNYGNGCHVAAHLFNVNATIKMKHVSILRCLLCESSAVVSGRLMHMMTPCLIVAVRCLETMTTVRITIKHGFVIFSNIHEQHRKSFAWKRSMVNIDVYRYRFIHVRTICRMILGEACHLSCILLPSDDRLVLIAGSKNVHLCFRTHEDIAMYGNNTTYDYASSFCHTIVDTLARMPDRGVRLMNFLALTRYTAVFEILNYAHQHIVNLSYLKTLPNQAEIKFIAFSHVPDDFDSQPTNLCAMPPDCAIEIARCLHLSTTDYDIIDNQPAILNNYLVSIKYRHQCEGKPCLVSCEIYV